MKSALSRVTYLTPHLVAGLWLNLGDHPLAFAQGSPAPASPPEPSAGLPQVSDRADRASQTPASADHVSPSETSRQDAAQPALVYRAHEGALQLLEGEQWRSLALDVAAKTAKYHEGKLYITHGDTTVSVYDCTHPEAPTFVQRLSTGRGLAAEVEFVNGKPWVVTVTQQALPLGELTAAASSTAASTSTAAPSGAPPSPRGDASSAPASTASGYPLRVVEPGILEIVLGPGNDVRIGDRFAVYRETSVNNLGGVFSGEEQVAVGEVFALKGGSALAELSRTAVVSETDVARRARTDQTESNVYPVRVAHVGEFGGTLRPIVNAGSPLGVGVLADIYATYWGKNYFVNVAVQPLGLGWTDDGNIVSTSVMLEGGYDARAFSVGLGVGVSAINGDTDSMLNSFGLAASEDASGGVTQTDRQETHAAFTLSQRVRLGALDGLNLSLRNLLILHEDSETDETGFIYGGTMGKLTVPLDRRNDLFVEGGGGVMGYWLVGAGVGTWVTGNGGPGSWKLSISAGAAGIWGTKETTVTGPSSSYVSREDVDVAGPMVSFGVSRRFGF